MLEHKWPCLLAMTLRATLVQARHGQTAGRLENVHAMRVMALNTIHMPLNNGMTLRQSELAAHLEMALEARRRILAGIHNKPARSPAHFDVFASRSMTGFAAGFASDFRGAKSNSRMRTGWKWTRVIGMTVKAGFVTNVTGAGNVRGDPYLARNSRTGI